MNKEEILLLKMAMIDIARCVISKDLEKLAEKERATKEELICFYESQSDPKLVAELKSYLGL